jgi:protein gp37
MSTEIEWADETWNPITGCDRVSPGCDHCYALRMAPRLKAMGNPHYQTDGDPRTSGPGFGVATHPDALDLPRHWRKPLKIFVNSMSDLFHARVPTDYVTSVFEVMAATPRHTYQVLTKRPERMARFAQTWADQHDGPLPNVILGTSIELDRYCYRADRLRKAPAAVRMLSLEPLLGPLPSLDLTGIGWVIVGGESGPKHRPLDFAWVRDLRDRCLAAEVPFLFKQVGGRTPKSGGRLLDGRTWDQFPARRQQPVEPAEPRQLTLLPQ